MKTKYTKKQIQESIKHWQKVLENLDESESIPVVIGNWFDINTQTKDLDSPYFLKQQKIVDSSVSIEDLFSMTDSDYVVIAHRGSNYDVVRIDDRKEFPQWWKKDEELVANMNR